MSNLLIGYDVEAGPDQHDLTVRFLDAAQKVHVETDAPASMFLVGTTLLANEQALKAAQASGMFNFHSHTYSHQRLKTLLQENEAGVTILPGVGPIEAEREIRDGIRVVRETLGAPAIAFTAPYNYYRGVGDRLDLLAIFRDEGVRILRSAGRNEKDWLPTPISLQPYFYAPQGYAEILECPIHGWHDCVLRERLGWDDLDGYCARIFLELDAAAMNGWDYMYLAHDWSSVRGDPDLTVIRRIIGYARAIGMNVTSLLDYYDQRVAADGVVNQAFATE